MSALSMYADSHGASQDVTLTLTTAATGKTVTVTALSWEKTLVEGSRATHPGGVSLAQQRNGLG